MQNHANPCGNMALTQFQLSKMTLRNLNKFNLKPTAKLVLLSLVDHYPKIFPSQQTIANELGIGLRTVKEAIKELKNQGIIIYETKYFNTYKLTKAFFGVVMVQKSALDSAESAPKEIKEKKKYKSFKKGFNDNVRKFEQRRNDYRSNCHIEGVNYQQFKPEKMVIDEKTPLNDYQTALNYIEELKDQNNFIVKRKLKEVCERWNISLKSEAE